MQSPVRRDHHTPGVVSDQTRAASLRYAPNKKQYTLTGSFPAAMNAVTRAP